MPLNPNVIPNLNILILEESEQAFMELKSHLQTLDEIDPKITGCYSYEEALSILQHEKSINLCFINADTKSELEGIPLKRLRRILRKTPVILIYNEVTNELLNNEAVNEYVLRKNFSPSVLLKAIRNAIEHNDINLQLRAQEEKYSKLFYSSLEAAFTMNEQFTVLECNESFRQLFDIEELEAFDFKSVFAYETEEELSGLFTSNKGRRARKMKIRNKNGGDIVAYVSVSPVKSEVEEAQYIGVIHDVTELENTQLKLAESDKLQMIQRMARIIGHEIRNPLTNIFLASEELKEDCKDNEGALDMIEMIHRSSSRISSLIDNFLKNARTDAPIKAMHSIQKIVADSIEACSDRIALKQIQLEVNGLDHESLLLVDDHKMSIVFTNILINAIEALEFTDNPQLKVFISCNGVQVEVVIEDNGSGMSEDMKKNLFTPFYSSKQGGLGLGMSNTFSILRAHDALINVESELDKGTRFSIKLPLSQETN